MEKELYGLNQEQREAVITTEGPLSIIAGPGTGKTKTLVSRLCYMIIEKNIPPENIMIVTFTNKAADELITRISDALLDKGLKLDTDSMYIGTFHQIFLKLLREYPDATGITEDTSVLDEYSLEYLIKINMKKRFGFVKSSGIFGEDCWDLPGEIIRFMNISREELSLPVLDVYGEKKQDFEIETLRKIYAEYLGLLQEKNCLDFSEILYRSWLLLNNRKDVLEDIQKKISYIMVDEYQDTNFIQEQLVLMLASPKNNICVVGDDDQSLYRFRGATVTNLLGFSKNFPEGECKTVLLKTNYRSEKPIISFYNDWMTKYATFSWNNARFPKEIEACSEKDRDGDFVLKAVCENQEEWNERILTIILDLRKKGIVTDLNQIAFLCSGVKFRDDEKQNLASYLENHGIPVYAPRFKRFFQKSEIRVLIGSLLRVYSFYGDKVDCDDPQTTKYMKKMLPGYYRICMQKADEVMETDPELAESVMICKEKNLTITETIYRLFGSRFFREILATGSVGGLKDEMPSRNLSSFIQTASAYEEDTIYQNNRFMYINEFFNRYLGHMIAESKMTEYEDNREYAPSGCISFITIHQSKGMEFPIVLMDSLSGSPWEKNNATNTLKNKVIELSPRNNYNPEDSRLIPSYDFQRLYYTGFSRAENLLILTTCKNEINQSPSKYFSLALEDIKDYSDCDFSKLKSGRIKNTFTKSRYAYTSDIALYETCPVKYKFYRKMGFVPPADNKALSFGTLVHSCIEDINNMIIDEKEDQITDDFIQNNLLKNHNLIVEKGNPSLNNEMLNKALSQIKKYTENILKSDLKIIGSEVELSSIESNYIVNGNIDMIAERNGMLEIYDFKTENRDELIYNKERLKSYREQLLVYIYLAETKYQKKVSSINLYCTPSPDGKNIIPFFTDKVYVDGMQNKYKRIIGEIENENFNQKTEDFKKCEKCSMKYYCKRV